MKLKLEWGKQNKDIVGNVLRNIEYINKKVSIIKLKWKIKMNQQENDSMEDRYRRVNILFFGKFKL